MNKIIEELLLLAGVRQLKITPEPLDMAPILVEAQERLLDLIDDQAAKIIWPDEWPQALGYAPWVEEVWATPTPIPTPIVPMLRGWKKFGLTILGCVDIWIRETIPHTEPEKHSLIANTIIYLRWYFQVLLIKIMISMNVL